MNDFAGIAVLDDVFGAVAYAAPEDGMPEVKPDRFLQTCQVWNSEQAAGFSAVGGGNIFSK